MTILEASTIGSLGGGVRGEIAALLQEAMGFVKAGRIAEAIERLTAVLSVDASCIEARRQIAKLHLQRREAAEAELHLALLARAAADDVEGWRRLAVCRRDLADGPGEAEAWRKAVELDPGDLTAHQRLADLALGEGRPDAAAPSLRALAQALPHEPERWIALAECLARIGDREGAAEACSRSLECLEEHTRSGLKAIERVARRLTRLGDPRASDAWRRVLGASPAHLEARTRVAEFEAYGPGGPDLAVHGSPRPAIGRRQAPRVLVVGNCQAYALARRLRALCPGAEVRTTGFTEFQSPDDADALARLWPDIDYAITQFTDDPLHGELRSERLAGRVGRMVFFPRIHFRGFHPDLLRAGMVPLRGFPVAGYHSSIVMAAYGLRIPERQVADLFNAYIYGVLGYFDAYAKAELLHISDARRFGIELGPMLAEWRAAGTFVHVPNHPVLRVFQFLAGRLAHDLGLPVADTRPDAGVDELETCGVWPVYPEIAARLGVVGGLVFRPGFGREPMELDAFIASAYRDYSRFDPEAVATRVPETIRILESEGL